MEFGKEGAVKDVGSERGMEMAGLRLEISAIDGDCDEKLSGRVIVRNLETMAQSVLSIFQIKENLMR